MVGAGQQPIRGLFNGAGDMPMPAPAAAYLGQSTQSRSGCFMRPANSPASGPQPAK